MISDMKYYGTDVSQMPHLSFRTSMQTTLRFKDFIVVGKDSPYMTHKHVICKFIVDKQYRDTLNDEFRNLMEEKFERPYSKLNINALFEGEQRIMFYDTTTVTIANTNSTTTISEYIEKLSDYSNITINTVLQICATINTSLSDETPKPHYMDYEVVGYDKLYITS